MNYTTSQSIEEYAKCVFEPNDLVEIRPLPSGSSEWHRADKLAEQSARLHAANLARQNIYAGVNPRRCVGGRSAADVSLARCLFADFDGNATTGHLLGRLTATRLPVPTIVIHSGHGIHCYYRLSNPITDLADWTRMQKALIAALGSDPAIHDAPRIMRVPGFDNCKFDKRVPCLVIDSDPRRRYQIDLLREILAPHLAASAVPFPAAQSKLVRTAVYCIPKFWEAATKIGAIDKGDGSSRLLKVARQAVRFGLPNDVAIDQIERYQRAFPFPAPWNADEIRRRLRDAEKQCVRGDGLRRRRTAKVGQNVEAGKLLTDGNNLPRSIIRAFAQAIKRRAKASRKGGER